MGVPELAHDKYIYLRFPFVTYT